MYYFRQNKCEVVINVSNKKWRDIVLLYPSLLRILRYMYIYIYIFRRGPAESAIPGGFVANNIPRQKAILRHH